MKPKHLALLLGGVVIAAIIVALVLPATPMGLRSWVGTAQNDPSWPFRYDVHHRRDGWHGGVERRIATATGWEHFDTMQIYQQTQDTIAFRTALDEIGKKSPQSWHLSLSNGPDGLTGVLTNDHWDSKAVRLTFGHF